MLHHMSYSMATIPQPQLWHLYSWCPYSSWASCIHKCCRCTLPISRRRCCSLRSTFAYDIDQDNVVWISCISTNSSIMYAPRVKSMSQYSSCVFGDHSTVFEPCFALCLLRIAQNVLYRRERKTLLTYMLPHLTVTWTVRHETNQSHLVPRLRMKVSYTPRSICLHALHNEHFTWDFPSFVVSRRRLLPTFRTIYLPHIQGSSSPSSSWTAETSVNNYRSTRAQRPGRVKVFFKTRRKPEATKFFPDITAT